MIRAACGSRPIRQNAIMETKAEHTQARIRKAARKARTRQRGRPVSVTHIAPPVPITEQMLQEIQNLHSADPNPFVHSNSAGASRILLRQIALTLPATFERMPRLRKSGQLGMRANHGYATQAPCTTSPKWSATWPQVPSQSVLEHLRAGQVTLLAKPRRRHRPFLMVFVFALTCHHNSCAGPFQHGVRCPDGTKEMIKAIQYLAEADRTRACVAIDPKAAFRTFLVEPSCSSLISTIQALLPISIDGAQDPRRTECFSTRCTLTS